MSIQDKQLTENFRASEFWCKCGKCGGGSMSVYFLTMLQDLREAYGKAMIVTSGFRCNNHNQAIKGAKNSMHLEGRAADIHVAEASDRYHLLQLAMAAGFGGVGLDKTFIHLDDREGTKKAWFY